MHKYYGHCFNYDPNIPGDLENAKDCLEGWEKYFLRNLKNFYDFVQLVNRQWIERSPENYPYPDMSNLICMKICVNVNNKIEEENISQCPESLEVQH